MSLNLERLIQHRQISDPLVVETMVKQYHAFIFRLAVSILDDPDDAEDATQEALIAAASNLNLYRGESSLKTWLYAIALNTCRGYLRKRRARYTMRKTWHALQTLISKPPTPEESAMKTETDALLWKAVDALDEKHRLPIILRYAHNLSVPEIAKILKINEGTAHSRLHYARKKLQGHLSQSGELQQFKKSEP